VTIKSDTVERSAAKQIRKLNRMAGQHYTEHLRERVHEDRLKRSPHLAPVIERNIRTIGEARKAADENKSAQDRLADWMTRFSGSMVFVYLHVAWFAVWIILNLPFFGLHPFDPFPYGLLTLIVSLEAIFLSTFVLLSQNRQAAIADQRADLDLHINLLAEYEITRLLILVHAIGDKLDVDACNDPELQLLQQEVTPQEVLQQLAEGKSAERLIAKRKGN
jgi:uncharacterized membrane protein